MKNTRSLVGQIPEPEELYGRDDFIDHLWRMLEANNILLLAPRRFGKSGVMRHVLLHPRPGYLLLSFQLDPDTNEFYFRLKVMQDWWRRWYPPSAPKARNPKGKT